MSADATPTAPTCPNCGTAIPPASPGRACPRCLMALAFATDPGAAPPPDVPAEEVHRRFPGYEVLSTIGRGGMGIVYRARQKALDREIALKVLPGGPSRPAGFTDRFAREAKALARLQHPGIVQVFDFGTSDDGWCFLAMELVEGVNLRRLLAERRLTPREALAIVPQICDALQYAHDHGVVHRDIKPENVLVCRSGAKARGDVAEPQQGAARPVATAGDGNVLVCRSGAKARGDGAEPPEGPAEPAAPPVFGDVRIKIADFGLAKVLEGYPGSSLTHSGVSMGTPLYMAPEQVEHPGDVDHRADIYSLGVVFYEMLTGELPIGRFAPPSRKSDVDARIDEIVLRTLEKEREARFQRASDVTTQIREASVPGAESPAGGGATASGSAAPRTSRLAIASALLVAPVALLVIIGSRDRAFALVGSLPAALFLASMGAWAGWRIERSRGALKGTMLSLLAVLGGVSLFAAATVHAFSSRSAPRFDQDGTVYLFPEAGLESRFATRDDWNDARALTERALVAHPVEAGAMSLAEFYEDDDVRMLLGLPAESLTVRGGAGHLGLPLVGADFFGAELAKISIHEVTVSGADRREATVEIRAGGASFLVRLRRAARAGTWRFAASPVTRVTLAAPAPVGGNSLPPGRTASGWPLRGSPTEEDELRAMRERYLFDADARASSGVDGSDPMLLSNRRNATRAEERLREIEGARAGARAELADLRGRLQDCLRRLDEIFVVKKFADEHPQVALERRTIARLEERIRELEASEGRSSESPAAGTAQPASGASSPSAAPAPGTQPPAPEPPK